MGSAAGKLAKVLTLKDGRNINIFARQGTLAHRSQEQQQQPMEHI